MDAPSRFEAVFYSTAMRMFALLSALLFALPLPAITAFVGVAVVPAQQLQQHPLGKFAGTAAVPSTWLVQKQQRQDAWIPLQTTTSSSSTKVELYSTRKEGYENGDGDEEEDTKEAANPYADPNYPDLEFVNYADPEYSSDRGNNSDYDAEEYYSTSDRSTSGGSGSDEEQRIEAMREERRRKNDEYQFQTYYSTVLKGGKGEYRGEWTVYRSSVFLEDEEKDANGSPRMIAQTGKNMPLTVISRGYKEIAEHVDATTDFPCDAERIVHRDVRQAPTAMADADIDSFGGGEAEGRTDSDDDEDVDGYDKILTKLFHPEAMSPLDFRGHQGNMVCGK
jgi:hypothetical protein